MNASAQVAQSQFNMSGASRVQQPAPLSSLAADDTGGPGEETHQGSSDSASVIGGGESLQHKRKYGEDTKSEKPRQVGTASIPMTLASETMPKIIPEAEAAAAAAAAADGGQAKKNQRSPASSKESPSRSRGRNMNDNAGQGNSLVAIRMDSKQQEQAEEEEKKPVRVRKRSRIFFNPSDSFCYWWSAVVSLAFLYNFWSLSYRFAFREIDTSTWHIWFAFDYAADAIYLVDIFVMFRTGYLEDGVLQRDLNKIAAHYQDSTLFYLDSSCLLPFDILYLEFGFCSTFRCNRLVKIHKFWSFVDRTERHTNYPNVFRTFTLVHYILVIFHWNACIFHMISKYEIIDIKTLFQTNDDPRNDISCQYLRAFYWSTLALTIIGGLPKPRERGEYIFVIAELFLGLFIFASVLGHVANIVTNVSAARKEFQARLDAVKTFMRTRRVSDDLQRKVIRWFDYLWISQKSSDEERSVACLPDRLKAEIAIHVNLNTLKRVDIFQATEAGFLRELVLRLKPVLFSPGDYVCRKDEAGHEMYIVSRGILEVVTNEGQTVVATFRAGSYFGEIAVLNVGTAGNKRTASVRSVGYSDLFCLSKQDLWDVLKDYPNAEARIRAVAEERLSALGERGPGKLGAREAGEELSRGRGRHSLRRAPTASVKQMRQRRAVGQTNGREQSADSLQDVIDDNNDDDDDAELESSGGGCVARSPQKRRVRSPISGHNYKTTSRRAATATTGSRKRAAPNSSLTMDPICGHAHVPPHTPRPLRQAASGCGLMVAGTSATSGTWCDCQHKHRPLHQDQFDELASNHCLCPQCHSAGQGRQQVARPSPTSHTGLRVATTGQSRSSSSTTCAVNHNAPASNTTGSSSVGGHRGGAYTPQPAISSQRHQLSVASCHYHHQRSPPLHIGQSRSFECTPTAGVRPSTADARHYHPEVGLEPDRGRSGRRAFAAGPPEAPGLTSSDATMATTTTTTTTTTTSTPDHTNQTTTILERRHAPHLGGVSGSDTTTSVDSGGGRLRPVERSFLRLPPEAGHTCDLRRSNSLREPKYISPTEEPVEYLDYDLEGQGGVYDPDLVAHAWQDHHQHRSQAPQICAHSLQVDEDELDDATVASPPPRQQPHISTCRKRTPQTWQQWQQQQVVVIPISPPGKGQPLPPSPPSAQSSSSYQPPPPPPPPPINQASSSTFQAINPPMDLHLTIDVDREDDSEQVAASNQRQMETSPGGSDAGRGSRTTQKQSQTRIDSE